MVSTKVADRHQRRGLTVTYLTEQFQRLGLKPAIDGTYVQKVPLAVSCTTTASFTANKKII